MRAKLAQRQERADAVRRAREKAAMVARQKQEMAARLQPQYNFDPKKGYDPSADVAAIRENVLKDIGFASLAKGVLTSIQNRRNQGKVGDVQVYDHLLLPTWDVVTPETPFLTTMGGKAQNLGNNEATRFAVRILEQMIKNGPPDKSKVPLDQATVDNLLRHALLSVSHVTNSADIAGSSIRKLLAFNTCARTPPPLPRRTRSISTSC